MEPPLFILIQHLNFPYKTLPLTYTINFDQPISPSFFITLYLIVRVYTSPSIFGVNLSLFRAYTHTNHTTIPNWNTLNPPLNRLLYCTKPHTKLTATWSSFNVTTTYIQLQWNELSDHLNQKHTVTFSLSSLVSSLLQHDDITDP